MGDDLRPRDRYLLPDGLRGELAVPLGPVLSTDQLADALQDHDGRGPVLAVGDHVSLTLRELDHAPRLFACDYHTRRGQDAERYRTALGDWGDRVARVANPPATLTRAAWDAVQGALAAPPGVTTRIEVDGEEDLLGLPCFLEAPDGAVVLYGIPGQGVAWVMVDAAVRARVRDIVVRMDGEEGMAPGAVDSG